MALHQMGDQDCEYEVPDPMCAGCGKKPAELDEYIRMGTEHSMSPISFVLMFEGTLNRKNGHFLCTSCYIDAGSPNSPGLGRWVAP